MVDYKLRLGDGTTFSVDEKGLTTWLQGGLVDDKARVQPAGSKKWFSIKQVLAAQGTQRGHAIRQTEKGRADIDRQAAEEAAEIQRTVAGQRAAEEKKAADDLIAAERKAAEDRNAAERKLIEAREAEIRRAAEEVAAAEARAAAEHQAEQDRQAAERLAAAERAETERRETEAREAERVAEAEKRVAAERAERAERKRKAEEARLEAEQRAAEEARLAAERRAADEQAAESKAAERKAAERKAAEDRAAADRRTAEAREASAREASARQASAREASAREASAREASAREASAREAERVAEAERLVAAERAERAERKRRAEEERAAQQRAEEERAAQQRAEDEKAARERAGATSAASAPSEAPPSMDKVEDFGRELGLVPVTFNANSETAPSPVPLPIREPSAPVPVEGVIGRLARSLKGFFTPRATPSAVPSLAPDAPVASPTVAASPVPAPIPPPKPPDTPPPVIRQAAAPPRQATVPPPSFKKLDVIPFAAAPVVAKVEEDVWEGDDAWQEPTAIASTFAVLWRWVKRITITTALIVAVALLALNREKWVPQARDASTYLGQGVDKLSERASSREIPPAAIEAARAQIPYLRAQTIEQVMATSIAVLEPAEVFQRAHHAAERARATLPHVVGEIDQHAAAAAAELEPGDANKLRAYLVALRAGTPTADYQDKEAVWLMARGVRRLPADQVARMEELFAQAVAAALQPPKS